MTVKQWLMRGWKTNREIDSLINARQDAFERLTAITQKLDKISVNGTKDPHAFDSYVAFEDEINRRIDQLYAIKTEIIQAINQIPSPIYRAVLIERYINMKTLEHTAENLNYSYQHMCRLQGKAFIELRKIIGKDEIK